MVTKTVLFTVIYLLLSGLIILDWYGNLTGWFLAQFRMLR